MNNLNKKHLINPLIFVAIATVVLMTIFEVIKQLIHVDITPWESHVVTIIFTAIISVCVTYFALRKYYALLSILDGFLPICANCKKIRDKKENWVPVEVYIKEHSNAEFTHGICSECSKQYLDEIDNMKTLD